MISLKRKQIQIHFFIWEVVANYRKRAGVFVLKDSKIKQDIKHIWPNITLHITSHKTYVQIIQFTHLGSFK